MVWLLPAAFAGLAAVIGPLIVHLLRRQRARTMVVPTVRFIPSVDQSVVRVRMPADLPLLLLRLAIVACAALALARPLFLTDARAKGWADSIARVTIVDVSNPRVLPLATQAASAELTSATFSHRIDATALEPALRRASAWLSAAPPARRELVVISDFRLGAIDEPLVQGVPATIGVRLIPVRAGTDANRDIDAGVALGPGAVFDRRARIDAAATSATFTRRAASLEGLDLVVAPEDQADASSLLRIIARAGAPAPSSSQPIVVRFAGSPPQAQPAQQTPEGWARDAAYRLLLDADRTGAPMNAAVGENGTLLVDVDVRPGTLAAAEALKAVLDLRPDPQALRGDEIANMPAATLEALGRPSPPADTTAWQRSDDSDGRWFWLAALVLLAIETWMRRRHAPSVAVSQVDAHAA